MKKITICLSVLCMSLQYASAQVSIMTEIGLNLSNVSVKDSSSGIPTFSFQNRIGIKIGTSLIIPISKNFFIQPSLFFSQKGMKQNYVDAYSWQSMINEYENSLITNNIEIPLNIGLTNDFGKAGSLFITTGPYFGIALSGKESSKQYQNGILFSEENHDLFGSEGFLNRLDIGINFGMIYKMPFGIFVRTQYGMGLTDISKGSYNSIKNKGFSFSTGYIYTFKKSAKSKVNTGTDK